MGRYLIIFLVLIYLLLSKVYSQNREVLRIDSIVAKDRDEIVYRPTEMFEQFTKLKAECEKIGYKLGSAMCEYRIAECYLQLNKGYEVLPIVDDLQLKAKIWSNDTLFINVQILKANLLFQQFKCSESISLLDSCFQKVDKLDDTPSRNNIYGRLYTQKAYYSTQLETPPASRILLGYHLKAREYFAKANNSYSLGVANSNIAMSYLKLGMMDSTLYYLQKIKTTGHNRNCRGFEQSSIYYSLYSNYYLKLKDYATAILYLDSSKAASLNFEEHNYNNLIVLYANYAENYKGLMKFDSVAIYNQMKDSVMNLQYKNVLQEQIGIYDKKLNKEQSNTIKAKKKIFIIIIISIFVLLLISAFFYRVYHKIRRMHYRNTYENILKDEKLLIKDEILLLKEDTLYQMKLKLPQTYEDLIKLAQSNVQLFVPVFEQHYPLLYKNLMKNHPDISLNDLKFCFFLKLELSSKDIAQYLFISHKAVQTRKNRLRKKMNLSHGNNLYQYLNQLSQ